MITRSLQPRGVPLTLLALLLGLLIAGCRGSEEAAQTPAPPKPAAAEAPRSAEEEGTLVYNLDGEPRGGFDAANSFDTITLAVSYRIAESLVGYDYAKKEAVPKLAESWEVAPDGKSVTLRLRRGVKFHDGTPMNADAVVFSLMRVVDEKHPFHGIGSWPYRTQFFAPISGVAKIDDYTVKVTTRWPDPILLPRLALMPGTIHSPTAIRKAGKEYTNHPVGTGPFRFVEYVPGEKVVLERFEEYWGEKPPLQRVIFKINADEQSKVAALLAGSVDLVTTPPPEQLEALQKNLDLHLYEFPTITYFYVGMNNSKPPLNNKLVRQAINYAIDKDARSRDLRKGTEETQLTPWPPTGIAFNPNVPTYPYDPQKAKALLAKAGYPNGFAITMMCGSPKGGGFPPEVLLAQSNLKAVGIDVKIKMLEPAVYFDKKVGIFNPELVELYNQGWAPPIPEPALLFEPTYLSENAAPKGFNAAQYKNPEVDRLITAARTELDPAKRARLYQDAQKIIAEDAVLVWGWRPKYVVAARKKVRNVAFKPNWDPVLEQFAVAER